MVTHFSGMIPLTHGYTLLWYDTINTWLHISGMIPEKCDTINTCVTHFSGMIPLTHGYTLLWYDTINTWLHTSLV